LIFWYLSNKHILIYILLEIYDMMNNGQEIELECFDNTFKYGTFNLKGELVLLCEDNKRIFTCTTQSKNNKWKCKRIYEIPYRFDVIGMSKYDKLYVLSGKSIYEWNSISEKSIKVFDSEYDLKDNFLSEVINCIKLFFKPI
jgi:hypothetical protein